MKVFIILILTMFIIFDNVSGQETNPDMKYTKNNKKNLILVAITNYNWDNIAIFFRSYLKANFENTDFVVYVHNMTENTIEKIKSCGTIVYPFPKEYEKVVIINSRWKIYSDFLKQNKEKYNQIFTGDVRDIYFQNDLFNYYKNVNKSFLGVAIEDGFLAQDIHNRNWLINAYGEELYKTIKNERIICVGTIWGTVDKFIEFSDIMWERLSSEWSIKRKVIEQAVGNYIIYHDKMWKDSIIFSNNINGPVMTIGLTNRCFINFDSDNNILNIDGKIASVIHQYDRKEDINEIIINKYYPELIEYRKYLKFTLTFCVIIIICLCLLCFLYFYKNKLTKDKKHNMCKNIFLIFI